jgi:hypothetical protein
MCRYGLSLRICPGHYGLKWAGRGCRNGESLGKEDEYLEDEPGGLLNGEMGVGRWRRAARDKRRRESSQGGGGPVNGPRRAARPDEWLDWLRQRHALATVDDGGENCSESEAMKQ